MENTKRPVEVRYQTLVVIWGALLASQVLFLLMIFFVKPQLFPIDTARPLLGDHPLVVLLFAVMALAVFLLSFVFRSQHMKRAARDRDASCVQTGLVLGCALSEISSILGLVLAFAFEYQYFFLWIGLGLLGILLHFPRKGNLDAAIYPQI